MRHHFSHRRSGMTLVELLVVVAILGVLAVAVLPTIADTTESRRTREAARVASSFMASAQSRALGRKEWSGFRVAPSGIGNIAFELSLVDIPPPYRGDTAGAQIAVLAPAPNATVVTGSAVASSLASSQRLGVSVGDLIRFADRDPWYRLTSIDHATGAIAFQKRGAVGQSSANTPWPSVGNQPFEIAISPALYGKSLTIPEGRAVDLTWSGYDDTGSYTPFSAGGVTVLYDGIGRLRRIVHSGAGSPVDSSGAVFFLIGRADRAGLPYDSAAGDANDSVGANWQYADSFWLMIQPATGSVYQAACAPAGSGPVPAKLVASQSFVRAYLSAGGGS